MNIIKLKDIIMPDDMPQADFFNKHLKGKYAYWIQMRYIVSFDHMRHEGYVTCEEDITKLLQKKDGTYPKPFGAPSIDVYDTTILPYIDTVETDRINNTVEFRLKNKFTPDSDITIDELKMFRTWLATELLNIDQTESGLQRNLIFTKEETHILMYYKEEMYDYVTGILNDFTSTSVELNETKISSCNCHSNSNLSSLYNSSISVCDPISIYKKNIYEKMVVMFSNIDFWTRLSPEFILEFKKYVDNIIQCDFPMTQSDWLDEFADCGCTTSREQGKYIEILKRLSVALDYIYKNQTNGHKNYITDALHDWARLLYEKMRW